MKAALRQNTLFGVAKSVLAYGFVVALYRMADATWIQHYIGYEIALGVSILATGGLQSYAYKEVDPRGLHLLSALGLALLGLLALAAAWLPPGFRLVTALVLLDRLADVQLQAIRQDGHFLRYNLLDLGAQVLTKGGFLAQALGMGLWPIIVAIKATASLVWLLARRRAWEGPGFWCAPWTLVGGGREWFHFLGFDALNYATGQLDLLLLTRLAPPPVLATYFYVRKFVRLPLVLLNYALDPAYIHLKALADGPERHRALLRLLVPSALGMVVFAFLLVPLTLVSSGDPAMGQAALVLAGTSVFWVLQRFLDLESLLSWTQARRTASRLAGTLAHVAPVFLPLLGVDWMLSLALIPWLAWVSNLAGILGICRPRPYVLPAVAALVAVAFALAPVRLAAGAWSATTVSGGLGAMALLGVAVAWDIRSVPGLLRRAGGSTA